MNFKALAAIIVLSLLFFSCNKDPVNTNSTNGPTSGVVTAVINGYSWGAMTGYAQKDASGALIIYAENNSTNTITIKVYPYNGPGKTYTADGLTKIIYFENNKEYTSLKGQVTVTSESTDYVTGSFDGEVVNNGESLVFTNGQFDVHK